MKDKEKKLIDFMKKVSPGSTLRITIDDIIRAEKGALIVIDSPKMQDCYEGGFRVNCRLTSQRLFELCKMDGAVIISSDLKRIFYANVMLTPNKNISTNETGIRHKSAEKTAKQAETFVISVSERRKKTTVFYLGSKVVLRQTEEIVRGLTNNLQILEKQREQFDELMLKINILEISRLVSIGDICKILQRCEIISRISNSMKKELIELGKEGNIVQMRFKELIKGIEKKQEELIRDYSPLPLKKTKLLLENLTFDNLIEPESISRIIFQRDLEEFIVPKGFRFLDYIGLTDKESSIIIQSIGNLDIILESNENKFEPLLKNRTSDIYQEIRKLREQILEGKVYF